MDILFSLFTHTMVFLIGIIGTSLYYKHDSDRQYDAFREKVYREMAEGSKRPKRAPYRKQHQRFNGFA